MGLVKERNEMEGVTKRRVCRVCESKKMHRFLVLGPMPLPNYFLKKEQFSSEVSYPLDVYFCENCHMVQLLDIVSPKIMFEEYYYTTGSSAPMTVHFNELAEDTIKKLNLKKNALIVDIGSNDGTLLKSFLQKGFKNILGVEPAKNIAKLANDDGVRTENEFFNNENALRLKEKYGSADLILGTNVFAHVDDLKSFVIGVKEFLSEKGTFVIEVPYLLHLIKNLEFDTIYHEHLSYFSIQSLDYLFKKYGMSIVDVENVKSHGGSIRVFVNNTDVKSEAVERMIDEENKMELNSFDTYLKFAEEVQNLKETLRKLLKSLKDKGMHITGYGASAKGSILLNYCKIGTETLDYISDTTPFKQGRYNPGMHIPIVPEEEFHKSPPDYAIILAWNYADAIMKKEENFIKNGGKFIMPVPKPRIV